MHAVLALALLAPVGAFMAPAAAPAASRTVVNVFDPKTMDGIQAPTGFFDPLGLSNTSPQALAWYRAAELKHGRVAMLACAGFIVQGAGIHFPGYLSSSKFYPGNPLMAADVTFESLGKHPVAAWAAMPDLAKWQILSVIFLLELYQETRKPHYVRGGEIGKISILWDPVGQLLRGETVTDALPEDVRASKRNSELTNGRLAMIGAMGFSAAAMIDGSVPVLPNGF